LGTVVSVSDVHKTYRQRRPAKDIRGTLRALLRPPVETVQALAGVTFGVDAAEIVACAGPNGAGKSTLIKVLTGLLVPDRGIIRSLGVNPTGDRARYVGRIGVVFGQRTELWWDQPISASFEWRRVVWNISQDTYGRMLPIVCRTLGLDETWNTLARELSLGQRMRADLGLALLHEPEILFLDEPTLGLDVLAKRSILRLLKQINREQGTTIFVTSHDMGDLEQLAARAILINRGRIAFDGSFQQLRRAHGSQRRITIESPVATPPAIDAAHLVESRGEFHTYQYDAQRTPIQALLDTFAISAPIVDVESHPVPIDDVFADIYEGWQSEARVRSVPSPSPDRTASAVPDGSRGERDRPD